MRKKLFFIRFAYWYGAILDFLVFFDMMLSIVFEISISIPFLSTDNAYKYQTATGAFLMLGWTILLIWAERKPIERRAILLITIVPVIIGITIMNIIYTTLWIISIITLIIFLIAYFLAKSQSDS